MSNDIVGTQVGIYNILYECNYKSKCGHKMYHVQCIECGWESDMMKSDAKKVSECRHRGMLSQEQVDAWYEKNKKQCLCCGKDIPLNDLSFSEYRERKFCSSSCSATYNNKVREVIKYNKQKKQEKQNKKIKMPSLFDMEKQLAEEREKQKHFCQNCGKEIKSKNKYCSQKCASEFRYNDYINKWKSGTVSGIRGYGISNRVRRYLFEKYDNQCTKCGWSEINPVTGKIPLEVHHIDGNYLHNTEDNLTLLCPNCHALTPTYKATNRGNGRKGRRKYDLN